jgi:hypothetical protein
MYQFWCRFTLDLETWVRCTDSSIINIHQMLEKNIFNHVNRKTLQVTTKTSNINMWDSTDMLCMYDKVAKKDSKPNSQILSKKWP